MTAISEKKIMTVLGPISPDALGFTSMHEHIMFDGQILGRRLRPLLPPHRLPIDSGEPVTLDNVGILLNNSVLADAALMQDSETEMLLECEDFKESGGQAILELSVPGISMDNEIIRRIARQTGLHIILSTGFYTGDSWPELYTSWDLPKFRKHMLAEIKEGIQGTDMQAGSVKIGLQGLNALEEQALRGAAQVCAETGLPLTIHPCNKAGGNRMDVIRILRQEGLDLSRVVFAHTRVESYPASLRELLYNPGLYRVDTTMAKEIMDTGANCSFEFLNPLGFELTGDFDCGDVGRMAGVYELIRDGYSDRMVLGNDLCGRTMLRRHGGMGYLRLTTFVIPTLRDAAGVKEADLHRITVKNPARILAH